MEKSDKLRIGLIGTGRLGALYIHYIRQVPRAELVAVAGHRGVELSMKYNVFHGYSDRGDVIRSPDVDAVIIASSTSTHVPFIGEAFVAKKPVLCEKPLALSSADAATLVMLRQKLDTSYFQMGFMRRHDAEYKRVKSVIESGEIGDPISFSAISRDARRTSLEYALESGGMILDLGIHDIDLARFLMGEVLAGTAMTTCRVYPELGLMGDIDTAMISLRFASGALGQISLCRHSAPGYDIRLEIHGTKGNVTVPSPSCDSFIDRFHDAFIAQVANFVDNVLDGKPSPVTLEDGIRSLQIAEAL